ncbi:putative PurR-regulated permease PerM [Hasllibacter halocynthiae]|uniref:Putative PurR-regulated permease PerM n=1 Tax=Hasllibacter halocynthiae TaxID=595589 RepID=A0A2T0X1W8_9RHOB|nr:AI-2E family transporter [Hasllibacter halocynthiae]PRY92885.1 putative PurR-regulated permease PerM [Hasllibacter halocynthiae]
MTEERAAPPAGTPAPAAGAADPRRRVPATPAGQTLATLVQVVLLVLLTGFLLALGKPVLLPILAAVIAVYVLVSASDALGRLPVVGRLPTAIRRFLVLLGFAAAVIALSGIVVDTIGRLVRAAPLYQANVERLVAQGADLLGIDERPDWGTIREATFGRFSLQRLVNGVLLNVTSIGGTVLLVIVYAAFLLAERGGFDARLAAALRDPERTARTGAVIRDINDRIGDYLAVKTLVNAILGAVSFAILWALGVDFPLFWALAIALLNYIPYLGSLIGVAFPVALAAVQFGDLARTLLVGALLTAAQVVVGSVIEPRFIGRRVNLSPFVVLVSLATWSSLWGLPGALLAVPLTSMLAIVLSAFEGTRGVAVLLADRIEGSPAGEGGAPRPAPRP